MKTPNKVLVMILLLIGTFETRAQQDPMISQYMTNQLFFNPAYSGTHDYSTASALYRKQWVSFPGSPETGFLCYDKNFVNTNVGLGFTLVNDNIGVTHQTDLAVQYSYHIPLAVGHLSLGIQGGLSYYNATVTDLTIWDQNDVVFMSNINNRWIPNFGAGAYYYTDNFYAGLSIPHLLDYNKPSAFLSAEISSVPNYERHYYIATGYVIKLPADIFIKPSVLLKYVPNAPLEADLNANVFFMKLFSVGVSYRTDDGIVGLVEINATKRIRIGYAYDSPLNRLSGYTNGTHEIMLAYDFIPDITKIINPRFF